MLRETGLKPPHLYFTFTYAERRLFFFLKKSLGGYFHGAAAVVLRLSSLFFLQCCLHNSNLRAILPKGYRKVEIKRKKWPKRCLKKYACSNIPAVVFPFLSGWLKWIYGERKSNKTNRTKASNTSFKWHHSKNAMQKPTKNKFAQPGKKQNNKPSWNQSAHTNCALQCDLLINK